MSDQVEVPKNVTLEVIQGPDTGVTFTINYKTITIGREKGSDMQLKDETVSNRHCQIVYRGNHFTVIDLGSLNKTKVNDQVYVQKNLSHGDLVKVGKDTIRFNWEEEGEITAASEENTEDREHSNE